MYLSHFGLDEPPFRITPHTDFFFDGANRGATLEALLYAITHDEGIVKVSGEVGSGKTMLCRVLMERLPKNVEIIYLSNPSLARDEILLAIADELKVNTGANRSTMVLRALQDHLIKVYADGHQVVVLIDEAHAMPLETLEEIRLLSNLESSRHKLLQIVLFGQPELDDNLNIPQMRQLKERITHSFRLEPLIRDDIAQYLMFRMRAAGYRGPDIFTPAAVRGLAKASQGLTRRINILADKSLLAAFSQNTHEVTAKHVRAAVRDSEFQGAAQRSRTAWVIAAAGVAGIVIGGLGLRLMQAEAPAARPIRAADGAADRAADTIAVPAPPLASAAAAMTAQVVPPIAPATPAANPPPAAPAPTAASPDNTTAVTAAPAGQPAAVARAPEPAPAAKSNPAPVTAVSADTPAPPAAVSALPQAVAPGAAAAHTPPAKIAPAASAKPDIAPPAVVKIAADTSKLDKPAPALAAENEATGTVPAAAGPLTRARMAATAAWLQQTPGNAFAIQVMTVAPGSERELEAFLARAEKLTGLNDVYLYETRLNGQSKRGLAVVYGSYPTRDKVRDTIAHFPEEIRVRSPYLRTLDGIRREIAGRNGPGGQAG